MNLPGYRPAAFDIKPTLQEVIDYHGCPHSGGNKLHPILEAFEEGGNDPRAVMIHIGSDHSIVIQSYTGLQALLNAEKGEPLLDSEHAQIHGKRWMPPFEEYLNKLGLAWITSTDLHMVRDDGRTPLCSPYSLLTYLQQAVAEKTGNTVIATVPSVDRKSGMLSHERMDIYTGFFVNPVAIARQVARTTQRNQALDPSNLGLPPKRLENEVGESND